MPPKKVRQTTTQDKPQQNPSKPSDKLNLPQPQPSKQQPKVQQKIIPDKNIQSQPKIHTQKVVNINNQPKIDNINQKSQKIDFNDVQKLTQQQRIKLRKLRYGAIGTDTIGSETQKIREQRLKKFGGSSTAQDKDTLQMRKKKFSNIPQIKTQDNETIQQRLKKFGQVSSLVANQDASLIQQRRKKFGNTQTDVNLDDLIQKSKKIKKQDKGHFKKGGNHHNNRHFGNKYRH